MMLKKLQPDIKLKLPDSQLLSQISYHCLNYQLNYTLVDLLNACVPRFNIYIFWGYFAALQDSSIYFGELSEVIERVPGVTKCHKL